MPTSIDSIEDSIVMAGAKTRDNDEEGAWKWIMTLCNQRDASKIRRTAAAKSNQNFRQAYDALHVSIDNMQDCVKAKGPRSCPCAIVDVVFATRDVAFTSLADGLQDNKEGLFGKDDPPVVANPMIVTIAVGPITTPAFPRPLTICNIREGQTTGIC